MESYSRLFLWRAAASMCILIKPNQSPNSTLHGRSHDLHVPHANARDGRGQCCLLLGRWRSYGNGGIACNVMVEVPPRAPRASAAPPIVPQLPQRACLPVLLPTLPAYHTAHVHEHGWRRGYYGRRRCCCRRRRRCCCCRLASSPSQTCLLGGMCLYRLRPC